MSKPIRRDIIGLIPAGGQAERLNPLPCSKELLPVGFRWAGQSKRLHPKPVCLYLLEKMRLAGAENAFIVLRSGKWDIPAYLADGKLMDMHLAYLMMDLPYGVPFTLDQAYPFVRNATIVFGFPDILFSPESAFLDLIARKETSTADLVLGLFPVTQPGCMDMVEMDRDDRISAIHLKPAGTHLKYTWIIATWTPTFTEFMHDYTATVRKEFAKSEKRPELCFSDVINAAMKSTIQIDYVIFHEGHCLDIGTPETLMKALTLAPEGVWHDPVTRHREEPGE